MAKRVPPLAEKLNDDLGPLLLGMLSMRGRRAFFPSAGILGQSAEAKGSTINATIGTAFEEDESPLCMACVTDLVSLPPTAFLYAPSSGVPEIRKMWADMMRAKNPSLAGKAFSLPVVTSALTHGLSIVGALFLDEHERIILPDLFWDNYELVFEETYGARLQVYQTFTKNGEFNIDGLDRMLMGKRQKRVILLNFPNNPTGYTPTFEEEQAICAALLKAAEEGKKLVVILDDAYFGLVYEQGVCTESLFAKLADLHPNILAIKLDGPTKEDYVWGARVGFITFGIKDATPEQYAALEMKAAGIVRSTISNVSSIGQHLLLKAYASEHYVNQREEKYETLKRRYEHIRAIFRDHPEYDRSFIPMPFNSGYFMCVRIRSGIDPEMIRKLLLEKGIGVIVLSGLIRIAFSTVSCEKLGPLFAVMHTIVQEIKAQLEEQEAKKEKKAKKAKKPKKIRRFG